MYLQVPNEKESVTVTRQRFGASKTEKQIFHEKGRDGEGKKQKKKRQRRMCCNRAVMMVVVVVVAENEVVDVEVVGWKKARRGRLGIYVWKGLTNLARQSNTGGGEARLSCQQTVLGVRL